MIKSPVTATLTCFVYLVILAPLLIVVAISFSDSAAFDFPPTGLSFRWYTAFFNNRQLLESLLLVSLPVGLGTGLISTSIGTLAATAAVYHRPRMDWLETLFLSPLLVPEILIGASLYLLFSRLGIASSQLTLIAGHTLIATPFVVRSVAASLSGIDPKVMEAAQNLGATQRQALTKIVLPLAKSGIISGFLFAFIISFSDINLSIFLSGPSTTTLPVQIYSQVQWGSDPTIAAASTVQIVAVGIIVALVGRFVGLKNVS